jgi:hypothetical protein
MARDIAETQEYKISPRLSKKVEMLFARLGGSDCAARVAPQTSRLSRSMFRDSSAFLNCIMAVTDAAGPSTMQPLTLCSLVSLQDECPGQWNGSHG